jgi:hypothetical protein
VIRLLSIALDAFLLVTGLVLLPLAVLLDLRGQIRG